MYNIDSLTDAAIAAGACGNADDVRIIFPFDLPDAVAAADGFVLLTSTSLSVISKGVVCRKLELSEISEFTLTLGIGCIFIGCTLADGGKLVICRGSNTYEKRFIAAIGDMNDLLAGKWDGTVHKYNTGNACPTCRRPLPKGSDVCPHCNHSGNMAVRIIKLASPWKWMIILSILLFIASSFISLISPYLNRILIDEYIKPKSAVLSAFVGIIVSMFAVGLINQIICAARDMIVSSANAGLKERLRQMTFDKVQLLSISKIQTRTSGELINRVASDTEVISSFITSELSNILRMGTLLIAVSAILFIYDIRIALLVLFPVPLILYFNHFIKDKFQSSYRRCWNMTARANSILHDAFSGIRVVKTFGMESREIERHGNAVEKERESTADFETFASSVMPIMSFILGIGEFFILYYVGNQILKGNMSIGEMVQFSSYMSMIYGPIRWISEVPKIVTRTGTSASKIFEILDEDPGIPDKYDADPIDIVGKIELENVSFSYDAVSPVMRSVSAVINPGEMVGIVGRSGVGKSTLINLVMRMYDPTSGRILIDGRDLREIPQESLRSQIGVVLQETYLFSGSIFENIRYAKPDASPEEIISAAKLSGAHKFIVKLPDGYDTKVGERGYSLSGGERQRVSLARALLRNPKILILDEATSALDTETEKEVQDVLEKLTENRTTLAIAHRLSTLRNADRILVLDKGYVAEFGSHEELIKQRGIYFDLVMAQRQMSRMSKETSNA